MNVLYFLTPKNEVVQLSEDMTLRQALEKMEYHRYQAVPILDGKGKYIGVLTEGDVLWAMKHNPKLTFQDTENIQLMSIPRYWQYRPVAVGEGIETLIQAAGVQSFIPVVDDGGYFIGIIKRSDILNYLFGRAEL